jgi:hypothetical protein
MDESFGLRLVAREMEHEEVEAIRSYESPVPLFASGAEAAEHGRRDLGAPGPRTQRMHEKLARRLAP